MLGFVKNQTAITDSNLAVKANHNNHKAGCCANKNYLSLVSHSCSLSVRHLYQGMFSGHVAQRIVWSMDCCLKRVPLQINSVLYTHIKEPQSKKLCGALHMQHGVWLLMRKPLNPNQLKENIHQNTKQAGKQTWVAFSFLTFLQS